jgi:hypothetical protein
MAAVPAPVHQTAAAIYALYEQREAGEEARPYLGASALGDPCARRLWMGFRWIAREQFDGRMLRLFQTGHREEARLLDDLRAVGVQIWDRQPDGRQFGVSFAGHGRGHLDAIALGLPEAPKTPHVLDVKTVSTKKLTELRKKGFRALYPKYHAQGTVYMGLMDLDRAAFVFVCKDTDEIHLERFEFDQAEFDRLMAKAERIIYSDEPPVKLSDDPEHWECKFCHLHAHCHGTAAPAPTCRSCAHATPERDGTWSCEHHARTLSEADQRAGCDHHRVIPILLANWAQPIDAPDGAVLYRNTITGHEFLNGPRPEGYSSAEIHACADKRALGAPELKAFRDEFDGRVVAA